MRFIWSLCLLPAVVLIAVFLPSQNVNTMHPQEIDLQKHASPGIEAQSPASSLALF